MHVWVPVAPGDAQAPPPLLHLPRNQQKSKQPAGRGPSSFGPLPKPSRLLFAARGGLTSPSLSLSALLSLLSRSLVTAAGGGAPHPLGSRVCPG